MARDSTKLRTFIAADDLAVDVYELTRKLPPEERYGLQSQIRRAAVSTPTNIVEGSVRHSDKHYLRYLENALGSACEVRYLMGLCIRLKMLGKRDCDVLIERYTAVVKGLSALITRIDEDLQNQRAARRRTAAESRSRKLKALKADS
ncbi:MAG TPA: four helix bundle protein [Vicinamibacterales bacterium]|nr:four helix bundle protein [Vicinamibacterales bacterium]